MSALPKVSTLSRGSENNHSVLSSGKWAKIRVAETGVHQLTEDVIRKAGFSDIRKVRIFGYGGNLQNESLFAEELAQTDDLQEVTQYVVSNGKHLFYAKGTVSWESNTAARRTRNPYSDYGYYFITEGNPQLADSATFVSSFYPSPTDYHTLYEVDGFSWYAGGRNLFDTEAIPRGRSKQVVLLNTTGESGGTLSVCVTAGASSSARVLVNGLAMGTQNITVSGEYERVGESTGTYRLGAHTLHADGKDTVTIEVLSGGPVRLDYVSMAWDSPAFAPKLSQSFPAAEYVGNVANQDLHADPHADMIIVIPSSQKLFAQALRLKEHHESHDNLSVNIVSAEALYNEFSSGTPDANAYRRYLRMLHDRATQDADKPKYLLLFGDCVWDNRMLTSECKNLSPADYLLCYESENSYSETKCYVSDCWMGILSEGAGSRPQAELQDVAVGRFPVVTETEARVMVDKVISYANADVGSWQNTVMMMGDDGNGNIHMRDENAVADSLSAAFPDYEIKKVMWDAYTRESSATGNTYPDATQIIKRQQTQGALIMDYAGHGSGTQISHEGVLTLQDFTNFSNFHLPLWVTASCNIMPFDGIGATIGEAAALNANGGAVAFYGTTRTVYTNYNKAINQAFLHYVLSKDEAGQPLAIGEAHRQAQNELVRKGTDVTENHLQYSLLGDPALRLALPSHQVIIDSIDGVLLAQADSFPILKAGSVVRITGHVEEGNDWQGTAEITVKDAKELVTCQLNNTSEDGAEEAFTYYDRKNTLYNGSDSVRNGKFSVSFVMPKDMSYSNNTGLIYAFVANEANGLSAHGSSERFIIGGSDVQKTDSVGPTLTCYLNDSTFVDGGTVNETPLFVAKIVDKDGINATGNGIGHDLQLVIDGDATQTYTLNDNFQYDLGDYTQGTTYYRLPEMEEGTHYLQFRAWDLQNNSSSAMLHFRVVKGLAPAIHHVGLSDNPAHTSTTFIVQHDRMGSEIDVKIEVFDAMGRKVWQHQERTVPVSGTYRLTWNLSAGNGSALRSGLYLYRVGIASDDSRYVNKTGKLLISR